MLPVTNPNQQFFCSLASTAKEEQVFGTAPRGDVWFLLEYRSHWEANSFAASTVPQPVKNRLRGYLKNIPGARLHFIKHQYHTDEFLNLFVAITREIGPALYRFPLASYEDILALDIPALLENPAQFQEYLTPDSIYLTCTHGRHDKCCAKFGRPTARALGEEVGLNAWQVSHLGGDRFAANVVVFPHGLYYGHVQPEEIESIVHNYQKGQLYLEKLRGHVCYNFVTQAADYYLRRDTGNLDLTAFRSVGGEKLSEHVFSVQFLEIATQQTHTLIIEREPNAIHGFMTCNALKEGAVPQHHLISHEIS